MIKYRIVNPLWRSRVAGRARAIGNRVGLNGSPEFESLLLRHERNLICLPDKSGFFQLNPPCRVGEIRFAGEIVLADGEIRLDGGWVDLISPSVKRSISPNALAFDFTAAKPRFHYTFNRASARFFCFQGKNAGVLFAFLCSAKKLQKSRMWVIRIKYSDK